jgi:hypothetical protein
MKNLCNVHCTALAACCALLFATGGHAHAQASNKSEAGQSSGAKSTPEQPKSGEQSEHRALSKAQQTAINQAASLKSYVDKQKDKTLDKMTMNRYTEAIGRALDDAQMHRQNLEASVPSDSSAADQYQVVRDKQQSAAEHYRSLVQEAAKTNPDPGDLKDECDGIINDLKDAEAAHKKTFPGGTTSTTTKQPATNQTPGNPNPGGPDPNEPPGSKPNRSSDSQEAPTGAPMRK